MYTSALHVCSLVRAGFRPVNMQHAGGGIKVNRQLHAQASCSHKRCTHCRGLFELEQTKRHILGLTSLDVRQKGRLQQRPRQPNRSCAHNVHARPAGPSLHVRIHKPTQRNHMPRQVRANAVEDFDANSVPFARSFTHHLTKSGKVGLVKVGVHVWQHVVPILHLEVVVHGLAHPRRVELAPFWMHSIVNIKQRLDCALRHRVTAAFVTQHVSPAPRVGFRPARVDETAVGPCAGNQHHTTVPRARVQPAIRVGAHKMLGSRSWVLFRHPIFNSCFGAFLICSRQRVPCNGHWCVWVKPGVLLGCSNHCIESSQGFVQPNQPLIRGPFCRSSLDCPCIIHDKRNGLGGTTINANDPP
eukprot:m.88884 g.88884  ORF g.88884 m.88884 type:complete len:357 (-) comp9773_c0_seq1:143-1213(-)